LQSAWQIPFGILLLVSSAAAAPPTERWMRSLGLPEQVAQLVVVPFYGESPHPQSEEHARYLHWVRDLRVGWLVLAKQGRPPGSAGEAAEV
jgi:hypothetical protein